MRGYRLVLFTPLQSTAAALIGSTFTGKLDNLIPLCLDDVCLNAFFPKGLVGFEAVDTFYKNVAVLTKADLDRPFLGVFQDFLGGCINRFRVHILTTIRWYVNFGNFHGNGFKQRKLSF